MTIKTTDVKGENIDLKKHSFNIIFILTFFRVMNQCVTHLRNMFL